MTDLDLRDVLARSTDALDDPAVVGRAAGLARTRLARRRAVLVVGAVATTAAILLLVPRLGTVDRTEPTGGTPTPSGEGLFTPTPTPGAGPIEAEVVQDVWDPTAVSELSSAEGLDLPESLDLPPDAASLETDPMTAAVAAVDTGARIGLVDAAGEWRTLSRPDSGLNLAYLRDTIALSPDGTRIAYAGESALWWRDVRGSPWRTVPYPEEMDLRAEWDLRLLFSGTEELRVNGYDKAISDERSWAVDLGNELAEPLAFDLGRTASRHLMNVTLVMVEGRRVLEQRTSGELARTYFIDRYDSLLYPALGETSLAVAREVSSYYEPREGADLDGLLAFDVASGRPRAYLPVEDETAWYSRAGLIPVAWVDDDVVLIRVIPKASGGVGSGTAYLATWDVESGDLARVSSYDAAARLVVATDLLGDP